MKTTATNKKIRELMKALAADDLVPRPYFQRRLVWTSRHKQDFIKTVLEQFPFPEIFLCDGEVDLETGDGKQLVVDGQQRITTLHQYFLGAPELRLGEIPSYVDLPDDEKTNFLDYEVVVRDLGRLSDIEVREIFARINSTNYSLNAMEVNNARFNGALKLFAEEVSEWPFFEEHRVFTAVDVRRMTDVRWSLTLLVTLMSGYFNRDAEHEEYLRRFNDEFPDRDKINLALNKTIQLIDRLELAPKSRAWQKNDLLTLIVELYKKDPERVLNEEALGEDLRSFFAEVDRVSEGLTPRKWKKEAAAYHAAVISGSNERARRIRRGTALATVTAPHFNSLDGPATADED